jgi:DNA repair exonuclease SbcCD ATPase subunit
VIVRDLRVEGFMRYERLELVDLPRGVIGVVGENEAGKTTIGEAIAFALFGRTIRTEGTDPTQAIHWEKDELKTKITIEVAGQPQPLVIERRVARTGEVEARLTSGEGEGATPIAAHVIADDPAEVAAKLHQLLGLDFSTFRYSFYVAQHELDLLQRDRREDARRVVWDMVGITTIERGKALLEQGQDDLREKASTLERDLLVAQALFHEMAPVRDELEGHGAVLDQARARHAEAVQQDARGRQARDLSEHALTAQRERDVTLAKVEAALVATTERQALLAASRRLDALAGVAGGLVARAEGAAKAGDAPRKAAREGLEKAQSVDRAAQALSALVVARRDQLTRELAEDGGPDALPARLAREQATADGWRRAARNRLLLALLLLFLGVASASYGAATRYPEGQPFVKFEPRTVNIPGLALELTPERLTWPLVGLGGALALGGLVWIVFRALANGQALRCDAEKVRLEQVAGHERAELAACQAFELKTLDGVAALVAPIGAPTVKDGLERLRSAAQQVGGLEQKKSPQELLAEAQAALTKAEGSTREHDLAIAEARRLEGTARHALEEARGAVAAAFPEGVPQASPGPLADPPATPQALADEVQRAVGQAVKARIELDALGGRAGTLGEALASLKASIVRSFEAHAGGAGTVKARYEEQSGIAELVRTRPEAPKLEDLRAVVRRERELLDELVGDEGTLRTAREQADAQARRAREELVGAQAELDQARARAERLEAGRKRVEELERRSRELTEVLGPTRRDLALHGDAIKLIDELVTALKGRLGPAIARYVELVLPRLTGGRYRKIRVDGDLDIRVYSAERGDFVRLIDLSLGTADQVLLALRLGLARALVSARGLGGGHFLFLDEPLVSADESREKAFLELLRTYDDEFAQILVTSPRRMDEGLFARTIELSRASSVTRVEAGAEA